ncbi:hypothetical protein C7N43_31005 [Sphingobacteriales bacterium UPWRP_1]|nr:hypothetical protein B6N25_10720 [Sphingobacteriales bacterium TSM_CSS]PSJ73071.1 hypothetical protein C7N43_31005 [Sphingobacteriales bacterium UPWRP_1]
MQKMLLVFFIALLLFSACSKETQNNPDGPNLIFTFKFDPNQERLNNFGQPAAIPAGHAAQTPVFNSISAHYAELTPNAFTQIGQGQVLYKAPETTAGGSTAIDFAKSTVVGQNEEFLSVPIKDIAPGSYPYIRISLAYQNYDIQVSAMGLTVTGTLASFIGFNTYISSFKVKNNTVAVNANKAQGYWGFESSYGSLQGQAPAGATTVPNPLAATSPIPAGSCLVTGQFEEPLIITGNETQDIEVEISLSVNNSFEWTETGGNTLFEPLNGDVPVDMGIRGMKARVK